MLVSLMQESYMPIYLSVMTHGAEHVRTGVAEVDCRSRDPAPHPCNASRGKVSPTIADRLMTSLKIVVSTV